MSMQMFRFRLSRDRRGLTLVEMLIAIAITLVMMGTVVSVFATISGSVQRRRSVIELGNQLRQSRNLLERDLAGITCQAVPWQTADTDPGYFEIVEGLHCDFYPSDLVDGVATNGEIDHALSTLPASNLPFTDPTWKTDGRALGDGDDILCFTTRSETEPFVGRVPDPYTRDQDGNITGHEIFPRWKATTDKSTLAEVVWYVVENPVDSAGGYFGEPGFRNVYRRALLIAPWLDFRFHDANGVSRSSPGVLRVTALDDPTEIDGAEAALVAFQERYDISARAQWDAARQRWTIVANTLGDLTKRENRYEHHGHVVTSNGDGRRFPFNMASAGAGMDPQTSLEFFSDPELAAPTNEATGNAVDDPLALTSFQHAALGFQVSHTVGTNERGYPGRPFVHTEGNATARAIVNEQGQVVHVTTGLVPLGVVRASVNGSAMESRRGEDLVASQVLAFDVQVFDPEAPVYSVEGSLVTPVDPAWAQTVQLGIASNVAPISKGAYVDLGYFELHREALRRTGASWAPTGSPIEAAFRKVPLALLPHPKSQLGDGRMTRIYDTWATYYEHNGVNEDNDTDPTRRPLIDEGTNGFDDPGEYQDDPANIYSLTSDIRLGVDDGGERETSPPYPVPLRAVQVKLRVYEPDSKQIREVTVRHAFVPE